MATLVVSQIPPYKTDYKGCETGLEAYTSQKMAVELRDSEWSDEAIGNTIRMTSANSGVSGREAYIALYWAMLGRSHGPKASALIFEIGKSAAIELFGS